MADIDRERLAFRQSLVQAEVLVETGVNGLYQRSITFESIARAVESVAHRAGAGTSTPLRYFPPMMPRVDFERTDYLKSFPDLLGDIEVFTGRDVDHARLLRTFEDGGPWTEHLTPAEVVLCSAACHPLYSTLPTTVPDGGARYEVQGYCFRHEPSLDPARMQSFRQHEFVFVGDPAGAVAHRDEWLARGLDILSGLGLRVRSEEANDPFFGRAGRILAVNQRETALKFEIVARVSSNEVLTAIASSNCHQSHFGDSFGIETADGKPAHSACVGFGLERITLALLREHGMDVDSWPTDIRGTLWP